MATVGGAKTTPYGAGIGTLEVGKSADLVLIDWKQISYPYLDEETPLLDAVIQRAKAEGVKLTMCDGEVIYQDGKFTKVDRDASLKALHDDLSKALCRRRGRAAQAVEGAAAARAQVLCELHRSGQARALLPAEFACLTKCLRDNANPTAKFAQFCGSLHVFRHCIKFGQSRRCDLDQVRYHMMGGHRDAGLAQDYS